MKTNATIEAKKAIANAKCDELLAAFRSKDADKINAAQEAADKAAEALTTELHNAYFSEWLTDEKPIEAALKCLWVDGVKVHVKRNGKTKEVTGVELNESVAIFNLDELNAWCKENGHKRVTAGADFNILADRATYYTAQRALYELSAEKGKKMDSINSKLKEGKLSCDDPTFAIAKGSDLTSNKTLEKVLQRLLDEIIFVESEDKPGKNALTVRANVDGTFFLWTAYKWNARTGHLTNPRIETISSQMLCIAHHVLSGKGYEELFDFKRG